MRVLGTMLVVSVAVAAMAAFYPNVVNGQTNVNSSAVMQPVMLADTVVGVERTVPAFQVYGRGWRGGFRWGGYGGFYPYRGYHYPYRSYRYYSWPYRSGCYWNGWTTVCRYYGW